MLEERLLGFDVREWGNLAQSPWDAMRRELFLLRLDVTRPLSVDRLVWSSVFDTGSAVVQARLGSEGIPVPAYIGPNAGLWDNVEAMLGHLRAAWTQPKACAVLACTWLTDSDFAEAGDYGPYLEPTQPAVLDPNWRRRGFDVGDGGLLSGLSNCGYIPEEAAVLRPAWGPLLNADHLFDDPAAALAFRAVADVRVPEHAPFFAYGLYVIEIDEGDRPWGV